MSTVQDFLLLGFYMNLKRIPQKLVIKNKFNVGIYFLLHVEKNCLVLAKAGLPLLVMYPVSDKEKRASLYSLKVDTFHHNFSLIVWCLLEKNTY